MSKTKPLSKRRYPAKNQKRPNTKRLKIAYLILEIIFAASITLSYYLTLPITVPSPLYLPQGSTFSIVAYLSQKKIDILLPDALLVRLFGTPQHGLLDMDDGQMTNGDFLYRLATSKGISRMITLIPGETTEMFFKQLADMYGYDRFRLVGALQDENVSMRDGYLIPETYALPAGANEETLIKTLTHFARDYHHKHQGKLSDNGWKRIIIMASIIQKEAANVDEMPLVASVIINRLNAGMPLQMDGTLNYGLYSHQKVTPQRIRQDLSFYNTYKNKGLPPEPVCTVSDEAINAALKPAKTNFLYFMKTKEGTHSFSNSYKSHLKVIDSVKK